MSVSLGYTQIVNQGSQIFVLGQQIYNPKYFSLKIQPLMWLPLVPATAYAQRRQWSKLLTVKKRHVTEVCGGECYLHTSSSSLDCCFSCVISVLCLFWGVGVNMFSAAKQGSRVCGNVF